MGILTAEFPPTSGDAVLAGFSVSQEPQKIRRRIGYCPQFDALFENMTGREHVELYASIKGIPSRLVKEVADSKLSDVGLNEADRDRLSSCYSGGMKRRLSLACATVGQPQIVFLDECSTGVDPVARREIWQLVSDIVIGRGLPASKRPGVILTTHSMEECEALCPRIGIMANGRLRCLGSAQHLKSKFGKGYQLEVKVKSVNVHDKDYLFFAKTLENARPCSVDEVYPDDDMELGFTVDQTKRALQILTGDDSLAKMVEPDNAIAYSVWRDASSEGGIQLKQLAIFVTSEMRMHNLEQFISTTFPRHALRERQDAKARYEVDSTELKMSKIFAAIEKHKDMLLLQDYSVSQTSLEQVFMSIAKSNFHES
jgi:ABC-type multidrug transport system ATPase subunit